MAELSFIVKTFDALTTSELYAILRLRAEVFVVEQHCVYQDIDARDQQALHLLGYYQHQLVAYSRCFAPGIYFKEAAIGRVLVDQAHRKLKFGHQLIEQSIAAIKQEYGVENIRISAQQYLIPFYQSHGFQTEGEGYLEDDIPHIEMSYALSSS